ncbi:hypothetical protein Tco_0496928 [Tanacetum coccineum]
MLRVKKGRYHKSYKIALDAIKDALLQCSNVNNSAENEVNDGIAVMKDKVHAQPEGVSIRINASFHQMVCLAL